MMTVTKGKRALLCAKPGPGVCLTRHLRPKTREDEPQYAIRPEKVSSIHLEWTE